MSNTFPNQLKRYDGSIVFELLPSRENMLGVLAIETLLGSLGGESTFSLEIAGDERARYFLIRAEKNQAPHF